MREICTLRVMWRELETALWRYFGAIAPVPDPTRHRLYKSFNMKGVDVQGFVRPS